MSELWSWDRCEETLHKLFEALDWEALGKIYFHEDGEEHWEELRPRVIPLGLDWARALLQRVPEGGVSLYAGAGIGMMYMDSEWADDPFYALKLGLNLELLPSVFLDISGNYRFNDEDEISESKTNIDTDTVFLGAAVRLGF
jgi:hypothetical protein